MSERVELLMEVVADQLLKLHNGDKKAALEAFGGLYAHGRLYIMNKGINPTSALYRRP